MNENLSNAKGLFHKGDYINAYHILNECSTESVLQFINSTKLLDDINKNSYVDGVKMFWHSEIPTSHFNNLFGSDIAEYLLLSLFSNEEFFSEKLLKLLLDKRTKLTIQIIKLTKAFRKKAFSNYIMGCRRSANIDIKKFAKEVEFIENLTNSWNTEQIYFDNIINETSYEIILIQTISYFEKFKRSSKNAVNNRDELTSREVNLCYSLNCILEVKRNHNRKYNIHISNAFENTEFYRILAEELPPLNTMDGIAHHSYLPNEYISKDKEILRDCIEYYISRLAFDNTVDAYCCGFINFEMIEKYEAEYITTDLGIIRSRNDIKNRFPEKLAINRIERIEQNTFFEPSEQQVQAAVSVLMKQFDYLKIPLKIISKEKKTIDLNKVLLLLQTFSDFLRPDDYEEILGQLPLNIIKQIDIKEFLATYKKIAPNPVRFFEYFRENYICTFTESEIVNGISLYFKWSKEESKLLIEYLTLDLNSNNKIDFLLRPFIKIGNQYYWLSSLLKRRSWSIIIHSRLAIDKTLNHVHQAAQIEKGLSEEFIKAKFNSINSKKYTFNGQDGEIDVIAYKDKYLFLIEIKTTYSVENLIRNSMHFTKQVSTKARNQLNRAVKYVNSKKGFREIKKNTNLKIPQEVELTQIEIVPLIVTNIFDYDDIIIDGKHLNISMFELMVILNNDLFNILNIKTNNLLGRKEEILPNLTVDLLNIMGNSDNIYNKNKQIDTSEEKCNLWSSCELSVSDFLSAIKEDKVWKFLDDLKYFPRIKSQLTTFDKKHKWLV